MNEIRVYVVPVSNSRNLQLRWQVRDPVTKRLKWRQESARTNRRRDAERAAARKAEQLRQEAEVQRFGWESIRHRFEVEHCSMLSRHSQSSYRTALNRFEDLVLPATNQDITGDAMVRFVADSLKEGHSPNTIKNSVRHLNVFFGWLHQQELIDKIPKVKPPKASKDAKGRPLTVEEFERYLSAISRLCGPNAAHWRWDAHLFWYSGLRLEEAYKLRWDAPAAISFKGIDRHQPMLWVPENQDKSTKESLTPLTPDLVEYIRNETTADDRRRGDFVFRFRSNTGGRLALRTTSRRFSEFGKSSRVITGQKHDGQPTYASCHDLRRSFGTRWASEVEAAVLQKMMRHKSITTTMTHYAFVNAVKLGDKINSAYDRTKPPESRLASRPN